MDSYILGAKAMGKRVLCCIFLAVCIAKADAQEIKLGWSLGDFGWSYNFMGRYDIADFRLINFRVSFETIPVMLTTALMSGTNKNHRGDADPFHNSFLPLEVAYSPFRWQYADISLYGRGAWEISHTGAGDDFGEISHGFFGALGLRVGLFPIQPNVFKYTAHLVTVFSEYTLRNEFKLGVSVDLLDIVVLGLKLWSLENSSHADNTNSTGPGY